MTVLLLLIFGLAFGLVVSYNHETLQRKYSEWQGQRLRKKAEKDE